VLAGALASAIGLAPAARAGAQTPAGANVVAQRGSARGVNRITTLLNVISSMPGTDKGREKYINEIVAAAAARAAEGHTADNAGQWRALGAQRRSFLVRRQQEARTGAEPDKKRFEQDKWMWCRLHMLQAAAYIVDGGDENIVRAIRILEQVLVEAKEIKDFRKRWGILDRTNALGAVAILLKPGAPLAEATRKRFARKRDPADLLGPVQQLYADADPKEAPELIRKTQQALQELAPVPPADPRPRKPNRWRGEAEGVVAGAVDSFLKAIVLIKDYDVLAADELARSERLAGRYRLPPALEADYRSALAGKARQLEIHRSFGRWTADPHGQEERLGQLLRSVRPEQFPALRYYNAIFDAWRTDKLYRRDDLDESQFTYHQSQQFYRRDLDRARTETPTVVAAGKSRLEQYAKALLELYGRPSRAGRMNALAAFPWNPSSPLERSLRRAVRYHLLKVAAGSPGPGKAEDWQKRLSEAAALCKELQQDDKSPDAKCLASYEGLRKQIQRRLDAVVHTAQAQHVEKVRQMITSGNVAQALGMATGPSSTVLPAEALLMVFRAVVRGDAVRDAGQRAGAYKLHAALLSRPLCEARRRETDTLYGELCVWDEYYRLAAAPPGTRRHAASAARAILSGAAGAQEAARKRYVMIRAAAESTAKPSPWPEPVPSLARRMWLEALIDAAAYDYAYAYLAGRRSSVNLRQLAVEGRQLPGRLARLIGHFIESPRTAPALSASLPKAEALLSRPDLPLEKSAAAALSRRLGQRRQTLRAAEIIAAAPGRAFAALRRRGGSDDPGDVSLDDEGKALWQKALRRLVAEADDARDFQSLAGLRTVPVPHKSLARRAMGKAVDAAAADRTRAAAELADSAAALLHPIGGKVGGSEYWFDGYMSLAGHPGFGPEQRRRWKTEAARYLPAQNGSAWDLYRQATLAYEVDDLNRCRKIIESMARRFGSLTNDLAVLGAACRWRQAWPSASDPADLSAAVARWWRDHHLGDPYESLMGLKGLRPGTSARRHLVAALVYLGRADAEDGPIGQLLDVCARAARRGRPRGGKAVCSRPYDRLVWDEPVLAGHLHSLLKIRLARTQSGEARRTNMASAAKSLLTDTSGRQWSALPPPVRQAAADAAYEGHCWARAAAVYGMQMRSLRDGSAGAPGRALASVEVEACRRWLECEVYRRAGRDLSTQSLIRHLRAAAKELSWTTERPFTGLVDGTRRSAASKIWLASAGGTDGTDDLYRQMVRKTANKRRDRGDKRFDNTKWGPLRRDPALNPYASLWCYVSVWPKSSGYRKEWAYAGPAWPRGLQDWVERAERQERQSAARDFDTCLARWVRDAGPAGRDRRAEAHLIRHLLYRDGGSLTKAIRTFAFGNPEFSLAVSLAEEK
jgi:hypothetical protein